VSKPPPTRCCRAKGLTAALVLPAVIGVVVGYFAGGRRTFDFKRAR
jgi:hypothetical protein